MTLLLKIADDIQPWQKIMDSPQKTGGQVQVSRYAHDIQMSQVNWAVLKLQVVRSRERCMIITVKYESGPQEPVRAFC